MKIVNITGGLGNQMFQCAFALALRKKYPNEQIFIDLSHYNYIFLKKLGALNIHNGFEISKFFINYDIKIAQPYNLMRVTYYIPNLILSRIALRLLPKRKTEYREKRNFAFNPDVFEVAGDCYYDGYWQCAKYIEDIKHDVIESFTFPDSNDYSKQMLMLIKATHSVGIHVRRGDYLKDKEFGGICGLGYYKEAIQTILTVNKKYNFFIFSNDIDWCKDNIAPLLNQNEIIYVDGNKGKESIFDMYLMSRCRDLIIANSSFSWWSAYFKVNAGRVIAPRPWVDRKYDADIYEKDWIIVDAHDRTYNKYKFEK